jgi:2-phospho-L-lactate guanylyltransferase
MRVVIPVKPLSRAKSRMASRFTPEERAQLVLWMLDRVLRSCARAGLSEIYVVGGDERVARCAEPHGAHLVPEMGCGLNETLEHALALVRGEGACLVLAADLPRLTPEDLQELVRPWLQRGAAALAPAHDGGTNALLLPPAAPFSPAFGPQSARAHRTQLRAAGWDVEEIRTPGLMHDVDEPEDLTEAVRSLEGFPLQRFRVPRTSMVEYP